MTSLESTLLYVPPDILGRWSLPVPGKRTSAPLERSARRLLFNRGRKFAFKNFTDITSGGNAVCVGLHLQGGLKLLWQFNRQRPIPFL